MKEVKIIGLKIDNDFGILKSVDLKFNPENKLIAVKGAVGSGKSTLQKSLRLGTQGEKTLNDDKFLYGEIDQEVEILDGDLKVFIGCKSDESGLKYVLYCKDENGKKILNPVIDGVKATPSSYLKSMQTALTWKMHELTSENQTVQKKIMLELYENELQKVGVIFDNKDTNYSSSILGLLDLAKNKRTELDILRKRNGGLAGDLKAQGYDVTLPSEDLPIFRETETLQKEISIKEYELNNISEINVTSKEKALEEIKNKSNLLVAELNNYNFETKKENYNLFIEAEKNKKNEIELDSKIETFNSLAFEFFNIGILDANPILKPYNKIVLEKPKPLIPIEENKIGVIEDINIYPKSVVDTLLSISNLRKEYRETLDKDYSSNTQLLAEDLSLLKNNLESLKQNNLIAESIESFKKWQESENEVQELRRKYIALLKNVNTGVNGLSIIFEEKDENVNLYLGYDGSYDTEYFSNPNKEMRKLSSYSGTQKPMIALLVQNYLLSKKEKAMRYIWIDDVPIDKKTQFLLNNMAEKLNLTVFVNITGDFEKKDLIGGEILVEGGNLFFN